MQTEKNTIEIKEVAERFSPKLAAKIPGFVYGILKKILHIDQLNSLLSEHGNDESQDFLDAVVEHLGIKVNFSGRGFEELQKFHGQQIMVASNHPFGGPEAMALFDSVHRDFPDSKLVAQSFLKLLKPMEACCVYNKKDVRTFVDAVKEGNSILIYPAGYCSRMLSFGEVFDFKWFDSFVRIAKKVNSPVFIIYTDGKLSPRMHRWYNFRKLFNIKTSVETLFLVDEMYKLSGSTINMTVGSVILPETFYNSCSSEEWASRLRQYCYELRKNPNAVFDPDKPATLPEE